MANHAGKIHNGAGVFAAVVRQVGIVPNRNASRTVFHLKTSYRSNETPNEYVPASGDRVFGKAGKQSIHIPSEVTQKQSSSGNGDMKRPIESSIVKVLVSHCCATVDSVNHRSMSHDDLRTLQDRCHFLNFPKVLRGNRSSLQHRLVIPDRAK